MDVRLSRPINAKPPVPRPVQYLQRGLGDGAAFSVFPIADRLERTVYGHPSGFHVLAAAIAAFKRMTAHRKKPQLSQEDFVFALELGGLPTTAERLRLASALN